MWNDKDVNDKEKTFYLEEVHDGNPKTFRICSAYAYKQKGARYVVEEDINIQNSGGIKLSMYPATWRITIQNRADDLNDNVDWMNRLDGRALLSNVNIPGTHNSSTASATKPYEEHANNYTCQMHFIHEQLNNGVRAFDIRYCKHDNDVFTYHGSEDNW